MRIYIIRSRMEEEEEDDEKSLERYIISEEHTHPLPPTPCESRGRLELKIHTNLM